jgi:uncharacterized delta-60 repeat protein
MNCMHRIAAALSLALVAPLSLATPGELDSAFGNGGRVRLSFPQGVTLNSAALQADGKVVITGTNVPPSAPLNGGDFFVVRLNVDGTLDTSFDGDGVATIDFNGRYDESEGVGITSDGHILVIGASFTGLFYESAAVRLNSDGTLDGSFGTGGKATYSFVNSPAPGAGLRAMAALPDGRYILAGGTDNSQGNGDFQFIRINTNGSLDTTFGTGGRTLVDFGQVGDDLIGVVRLPDGRIVGAGNSQKNGVHAISAVRLLATGLPDTSVGDGRVSLQFENGGVANAIALTADGKLLIGGTMPAVNSFTDLGVIARLLPDGTLDPTFGSGGRVVRGPGINALTTDANGHVYFSSDIVIDTTIFTSTRGLVQALDSDGSALDDFAVGVAIDSGHDDSVSDFSTFSMLRLGDGRLIVLGRNVRSELSVARLLATGGSGGVLSLLPGYLTTGYSGGHSTVSETSGGIDYVVQRSGGSTGPVSVHYEASSTTAVAGTDFAAMSGTLSWADGELTPKPLKLPLIDDTDFEANPEPITLALSAPTGGAALGTSKVEVYVSSDEREVQHVGGSGEAFENDATIELPVSRSGDARVRVTVDYTVVGDPSPSGGGTAAVAGTDFTPVSGTLTWDSYDVSRKYITVPLLDDNVQDGTRRIIVQFSNPSPGLAAPQFFNSSTGTIYDDEGGSSGAYFDFLTRNVSVDESAGTVTLNVRRNPTSGSSAGAVTFDVSTDFYPTTATPGLDFGAASPAQLSWNANEFSTKTITVPIVDDTIAEGPEELAASVHLGTSNYASTRILIDDNDAPVGVGTKLSMRDATLSVPENVGTVSVFVERTGNLAFPVWADLAVSAQGATQGTDFTAGTTTLSWAAGDGAPKAMNIPISADNQTEGDETFTLTLQNLIGGATLGSRTSTVVTIQGDLAPGPAQGTVGFTTDTITVSEDAEYVDLPVARTAAGSSVSLAYGIRSGATADIGREVVLVPKPGSISFSDPMPVDTVQKIRIYLNGDLRDEPEENFTVDLRRSFGGLPLGTSAITVKLASAEVATPPPTPTQFGFAATSISQQESQTTLNVTVNRTRSTSGAVAVHYETVGGTATAGSDFTTASGDLQWAAGDSNPKTIALTLTNDTAVESTETFTVKLSAPTGGATLSGDTATVSITDDDTAPPGNGGSNGGSGSGGTGGSGSGGGGGGGAFDPLSLLALGLILAFSSVRIRRAKPCARPNR